ncbi:hypothetical protein GGI21_005763 [Coemansia aciculifera]|nr:hypothetical protein GGI21_005763 [Coemansia aciculifera]
MRLTYASVGKWFRCWQFGLIKERELFNLPTCMLFLALVCPNFDYAAVDGRYRKQFMEALKAEIDEPEFSPDALRLQRLLFSWEE